MKITQTKFPLIISDKFSYRVRLKLDNTIHLNRAFFRGCYIENNKLVAEFWCYYTNELITWWNFEDYSFEMVVEEDN